MKHLEYNGKHLLKPALLFLFAIAGIFIFYSCSQLGIVSKTDRINMFIADLNSSIGNQSNADAIVVNFSKNASMYEQIKIIDWWESSVLGSANKTFKVSGLTESDTDNTVTGTIKSDGGLDASITFAMVRDPENYFGWLIAGIIIEDSSQTVILKIN